MQEPCQTFDPDQFTDDGSESVEFGYLLLISHFTEHFVPLLQFLSALIPSVVLFALESPDLMFQQGFYCDDESIRYPYKEDTISIGMLVAVGLLVPIVTVSLLKLLSCSIHILCAFLKLQAILPK